MPPKRRRRASPLPQGLAAGEQLRRNKLPGNDTSELAWVGTQVLEVSEIALEHRLTACGLSRNNRHPRCANKYASIGPNTVSTLKAEQTASGELQDDVIVISDDDEPQCSKKLCKNNPYCLNYLGQDQWEDEGASVHFARDREANLQPFSLSQTTLEKLSSKPSNSAKIPYLILGTQIFQSV